MRASVDQDDVSFYAPSRRRAVRLAQVSEVATALTAERTERGATNGTSRLLPDLAGRAARSLDPEIVPPPPLSLRFKWGRWVGLVTAILAFIVIAFLGVGRFFPIATASRQQASDRSVDLPPPRQRVAAGLTKAIETESPPLLLREWRGMSVEPAPFAGTLQGWADGTMVLLSGLAAPGSDGAGAWQVPDAVLGKTWIVPAKNLIGMDLLTHLQLADTTIARRWPIHLDWTVATPPVEAQRRAVTPRQSMPTQREPDPEEIAILVKRGKGFFVNGDPASARVMLQRAAESKNPEAALMLAATYDPVVLRELKVRGVAADVAMARSWYENAKAFGSEEAPRLLEILVSATR
jgi:hypothetical protein